MAVYRRVGRPGLIGLAARTAVVAGTASAVSGGMRARQQNKAAAAQAEAQAAAQAAAPTQAPAPAAAPAPAPAAADAVDPLTQKLQQLAALHAQGILTDEEFTTAKARLLAP